MTQQNAAKCPTCGHAEHSGKVCSAQIMPGVFCYCGVHHEPQPPPEGETTSNSINYDPEDVPLEKCKWCHGYHLGGCHREPVTDVVASPAMSAASVYEVHPDAPLPSCHACGAMMIPTEWKCSSCGTTTSPTAAPPAGMTAAPTLEEWFASTYQGSNLDKLEIPARVAIQIAKSYSDWNAAHLRGENERLREQVNTQQSRRMDVMLDYLQTQWDFFWHYWYICGLILGVAGIMYLLSKIE